MSRKNRHRASHEAEPNGLTTVQTAQPIQEKTMEATQEVSQEVPAATLEVASGPTAKEMAAAEELNQVRSLKLAELAAAPPPSEPVPIADVAARGYDALHEAFRKHNENNKPKEYVPPPRTDRQMAALQEELEAGRRTQQRAEAQQAASRPAPTDLNKEGFTTPVYRPNDVVPDPVTGKLGQSGATAP